MEEKSFANYIFNKINGILGAIGSIIGVGAFLYTQSWLIIVLIFVSALSVIFFLSAFHSFVMWKKLNKKHSTVNKQLADLRKKYDSLNAKFTHQSEKYNRNIIELNQHKKMIYAVGVLVDSQKPTTREGKELIAAFRTSINKALKEDEDHEKI